MGSTVHPDIDDLRRIRILSQFNEAQLSRLAQNLTIETASKQQVLIKRGCSEDFSFYLLKGPVNTVAPDGLVNNLHGSPEGELIPLAQIRPSMYDVVATGFVNFFKIYTHNLTEFAQQLERDDSDMNVLTIEQTEEESELTIQLFQDMMSGNLSLPSLPNVAHRIQQAFASEAVNAEAIAVITQSDPAITAKLIMISNSALYRGREPIETLQQAVVRLGLETTRKQVMTYAVKELFREKNSNMKSRMQSLLQHSQKVASLSRLLALRLNVFDAEQAQLAGLIHDLGEIAILQYAQEHHDLCENPQKLLDAIRNLRPQITGMLLTQWKFTPDFISVGEESEDWFRNPGDEPDLCDLVLIAQYHSFIGTAEMESLPPISKLPAFDKLGLSDLGPKQIIEFMNESRAELEAFESHLGAI